MPSTIHAFDYLAHPGDHPVEAGVCALFGDEPLLKRLALAALQREILGEDEDAPCRAFDGPQADWRDVRDELCTVSLFGGGIRVVVIEEADKFVSAHRDRLEDYAATPAGGLLVLLVDSWPGNTRLAKAVAKSGAAIECRVPHQQRGKAKVVDQRRIARWLAARCPQAHGAKLSSSAAEELLELVGPELGLLDTELAKLALFVEPRQSISADLVRDVTGGWRTKSVWQLVDAAADGDAAEALAGLDRLLGMGEAPQALFAQIAWSLRRFADATRIYQHAESTGRRMNLAQALEEAGFRRWQIKDAEGRLRQIGRHRAGRLHQWLLEADLALKGTHSHPTRGRLVLEQLLTRLARSARDIDVALYAS